MTAESGSSRKPQSAFNCPNWPLVMRNIWPGTQVKSLCSNLCPGREASCQTAPTENRNETPTMPGQIRLTSDFGSFLPISSISKAPAAGNSGMSQMESRKLIMLPLHQVNFVGVDRFLVAEQGDDDAETHRSLRRR